MLARFLSVSSTNFCNANNNGNANNNASNSNGVVPDSLARRRHECGSIPSLEKETGTCGESPKQGRDAGRPLDGSCHQHGFFLSVIDPYSLLLAYYGCRKGVSWKGSIQRYEQHLIRNIARAIRVLEAGGVITKGFYEFDINERGKRRHIRSVHISERVVQKSLCDNALVPILSRSLIHDNGASLSGKGTSFGGTGLGLGSQVSQISAIYYLNAVDHYAKEELGLRQYGRYMDDSYFIVPTKEEAREKLGLLGCRYAEHGIAFNSRKTHVVKLSRGFTFMKCQYRLLGTGRVLMRPAREGQTRMARKMRKFRKNGLEREAARTAYKTWRGYWKSLGGDPGNIDALYDNLFGGVA